MAAIDLYTNQLSSSSSSDQELMKALEPFIRSASSPTSSTSTTTTTSPFSYPYLSALPQDSYYYTYPAAASSYTALPLPPPAPTATSFSELPPLPPSSASYTTLAAPYPTSSVDATAGLALNHLGPAQIQQIQAQLMMQQQQRGLHAAYLRPWAQVRRVQAHGRSR